VPARIALFSDIHGNTPGLRAVLEDIRREGCTRAYMLGDLINGVDPHGCIQVLRQWADAERIELDCLKGNGEEYLLTPNRDALLERDEDWNLDMVQLTAWWEAHVTPDDLAWIATFQDYIRWDSTLLVHDRPQDRLEPQSWHNPDIEPQYQEWFFHSPGVGLRTTEAEWQSLWAYMDANRLTRVFCGHSHEALLRRFENKLICNIGSAGSPLDGDPRASWVSLTGDSKLTMHRVAYDVSQTHALIDRTDYHGFDGPGYKEAYKKWFATGLHWKLHMPRPDPGAHDTLKV